MSLKQYLSATKYIIGNYFESEYPWIEDGRPPRGFVPDNPGDSGLCEVETEHCVYLPILAREANLKPFPVKRGTSYYYADSQRIAMRTGGEAYLLFGDHLGSSSLLVRADGTEAEKAYYLPWGGERGNTSITSTDYGYTGQMKEGDIYYYGARWYDPSIGRFMQADTIVPLQVQGTQAFDRYAYVNNNPLRYTDPSGQWACANHSDVSCVETDSEFSEHLAVIAVELTVEEINDFPKYQSSDGSYMNVYEAAISGQILAFNQEGPTAISSQEFAAILLVGFSRVSLINSEIEKKAEGHKNPHTIPKFTSFSIYRFSFDSPFYNGSGKNYDRSQGGNGYDSDQEMCFDYLGCMGRSDANYSYQALF